MITSVNLCTIPFQSNTDSTRLSMSSKQINQALTHLNCEIPYVISEEYRYLRDGSYLGIKIADDDGHVIYNNDEIMIIFYDHLNKSEVFEIPPIKKTYEKFASSLRFSRSENSTFKKGDILYEYDCFINGVPSFGYNVFTAFFPAFGYNHEDSLIISESLAERAKVQFIDKIYIPIYEYTLLQRFYEDIPNSYHYFPAVSQKIKQDTLCRFLSPKNTEYIKNSNPGDIKNRIIMLLKNMNLSNLLSLNSFEASNFTIDKIETKIEEGTLSGLKIHKLHKDGAAPKLLDTQLQNTLEGLFKIYGSHIMDIYRDLTSKIDLQTTKSIMKRHYLYTDKDMNRGTHLDLKNAAYILEFEITKEDASNIGDKLANRS